MGQKVHPYVLRIGFGKNWLSRWFVDRRKSFADFLEEDVQIRRIIKDYYQEGSISRIIIERVSPESIRIKIYTSRPGVIYGRRRQEIDRVKGAIYDLTKKEITIDVLEVSEPAVEAQLVAELVAFQLVKRVHFRRAMKKAVSSALQSNAAGIKIMCSGRLGGAEIARTETYKQGKVPLQTFRSDIDYGFAVAKTTYGTIGIKIWIYRKEAYLGDYLKPEEEVKGRK